jgi:DNA-binding winged helix-turn-helix (wHTH) protein
VPDRIVSREEILDAIWASASPRPSGSAGVAAIVETLPGVT